MAAELNNPAVDAFVTALNDGDRDALFETLIPGATMTDDGTERDLTEWVDKEVFRADGRIDVEETDPDGLSFTANYTHNILGVMRTRWSFTVTPDSRKITHFDTGQA
jgi:hypothetical protein